MNALLDSETRLQLHDRIAELLTDGVSYHQMKLITDNLDLFNRFNRGCERKFVWLRDAVKQRTDVDFIVYIRELDLYGLCNAIELQTLSDNLMRCTIRLNHQRSLRIAELDLRCESLTKEERAEYDACLRADAEDEKRARNAVPKLPLCQVILACDACKLVFCCTNAEHVISLKRTIKEKWAKNVMTTMNASGITEITVDSCHANHADAREFYKEIVRELTVMGHVAKESMLEILTSESRCGIENWRATIDSTMSNLTEQMKAIMNRPATVIHTVVGSMHGGVVNIANTFAATSSAETQEDNPSATASAWIATNPPKWVETCGQYYARYASAFRKDKVGQREFAPLIIQRGYARVRSGSAMHWSKK